jgi:hypothetical protein
MFKSFTRRRNKINITIPEGQAEEMFDNVPKIIDDIYHQYKLKFTPQFMYPQFARRLTEVFIN